MHQHERFLTSTLASSTASEKSWSLYEHSRIRAATRLIEFFLAASLLGLLVLLLTFRTLNPRLWFPAAYNGFAITSASQSWGALGRNLSVERNPLSIRGKNYKTGIGTHAESNIEIKIDAGKKVFEGACGIDDESKGGSIRCIIKDQQTELFDSGVLTAPVPHARFRINIVHTDKLTLIVTDAGDGRVNDHADWVDLRAY